MQTATAEDLDALIQREKQVSYNAERGAVQVAGCSGILKANLPLTNEQITSLTALQDR